MSWVLKLIISSLGYEGIKEVIVYTLKQASKATNNEIDDKVVLFVEKLLNGESFKKVGEEILKEKIK